MHKLTLDLNSMKQELEKTKQELEKSKHELNSTVHALKDITNELAVSREQHHNSTQQALKMETVI